jgi:hypothetical protein
MNPSKTLAQHDDFDGKNIFLKQKYLFVGVDEVKDNENCLRYMFLEVI